VANVWLRAKETEISADISALNLRKVFLRLLSMHTYLRACKSRWAVAGMDGRPADVEPAKLRRSASGHTVTRWHLDARGRHRLQVRKIVFFRSAGSILKLWQWWMLERACSVECMPYYKIFRCRTVCVDKMKINAYFWFLTEESQISLTNMVKYIRYS